MCVTYSKNWNLLLYMWNIFVTCLWHVVMCWKNNSYHMGKQFSKSKIKDDRMTSNDTLLHLFCWHWTLEKTRKKNWPTPFYFPPSIFRPSLPKIVAKWLLSKEIWYTPPLSLYQCYVGQVLGHKIPKNQHWVNRERD